MTVTQDTWRNYRRKGYSQMRPYVPGEDMTRISVNSQDRPMLGGMIARNPVDFRDQWYISETYFKENLEEVV